MDSDPQHPSLCDECGGLALYGIDPDAPCAELPGTAMRIAVYATRYRAQIEIWNPLDSRDED